MLSNNKVLNEKVNKYIADNFYKPNSDLVDEIYSLFDVELSSDAIGARKRRLSKSSKDNLVTNEAKRTQHKQEGEIAQLKAKVFDLEASKKLLISQLHEANNLTQAFNNFEHQLSSMEVPSIKAKATSDSESTAVMVLSDWHYEENIEPESVNGLNKFTVDIAKKRVTTCFQNSVELLKLFRTNTEITNCVIALLGDFITNSIHEELVAINEKTPADAIVDVYSLIVAGFEFLQEEFPDMHFTVICKVGNHSRTTRKVHVSTETGNSWEYVMYYFLAQHFKNNSAFDFILEKNYLTYFKVYEYVLRFHHGHQVKYNGGVGGITIPVKKAIAQWDKSRSADIDVFGHFHQTVIDKNFICNGSLIGYSPYAVAIKAEYEKPSQTMFLINKKYGRTLVAPIFLEKEE